MDFNTEWNYIINKIRDYQNKPTESFSTGICFLLLGLVMFAGYYIFFFNPSSILDYIRFPIMFIYILLFAFILFFILRRLNSKRPLFNLSFELSTHTFTFGKLILFAISIFLAFYICYNAALSILFASFKVSILLTVIILILILAIINSYTNMYDTDTPNVFIDYIKDLIFYIPCLITEFIDFAKKDYKDTPSTVFILFIMLIIICFIYLGIYFINFNNPLLLINTPVYLNTSIISYDKKELTNIIISSRPWYQRELLRCQSLPIYTPTHDEKNNTPIKELYNFIKYESNVSGIENFTSIISNELLPSHLNISEYDKYILKQAMYNDSDVANKINNVSTNTQEFINYIIEQQTKLMSYYELILLYFATLNSSDLSKSILGDLYKNTYHYGISFWVFFDSNLNMTGKDIIFQYGSKPSMYYNQDEKELTVENNGQVLYQTSNILYQRWNHIVMNYNYGTFDLFINNNLVGTYPNIITYTEASELFQVGFTTNNNLGGIAQMIYSEEPLELHTIQNLYNNPPKI